MSFLIVNKPVGMSSAAVIYHLRRITGIRKIGHAGTLDPLASGVLVVGVGKASTRQLSQITAMDKEYAADITLGVHSATGDAEGPLTPLKHPPHPALPLVLASLTQFTGPIQQMPPAYSAIKIHGQPAYQYARKGKPLILGPRSVTIHRLNLIAYVYPQLSLQIICGSGVYIRALARDLGQQLGTEAYLSRLVRTRIGPYFLNQALTLDQVNSHLPPRL